MRFNIAYLLCAIGLTLLVLFQIKLTNNVKTFSRRLFVLFVILGLSDVILDIVTAFTIDFPEMFPQWFSVGALLIFYFLQIAMSLMLYLYEMSLRGFDFRHEIPELILRCSCAGIMVLLVIGNLNHGWLYGFDANNEYYRGPLYLSMYVNGLIYLLLTFVDLVAYRKKLAPRNAAAIFEFIGISAVMALIQTFYNNVLLTGVGICASLIVLMLTINNPYQRTDSLTGLFDVAALRELLEENYLKKKPSYAVVIALDNLKRINLVFGIREGNRLMKYVARECVALAGRDFVFRFIGDRFIILSNTREAYERIFAAMRKNFPIPFAFREKVEVNITASVCGIPNSEYFGTSDEMLDFVDYMVNGAKASGKNSVTEADDVLISEYGRRKLIEEYIFTSIKDELFELEYQPIYSARDKRFSSIEALARLNHPELGSISPSEFIPIAESSGDISAVEMQLLKKICKFVKDNPAVNSYFDSIKINLSATNFIDANLSKRIIDTIVGFGLDPRFFQFEITESAATVYEEETGEWAEKMKEVGIGLCLDDFGSGFANLDAVMRLPFDVVKLDRSMLVNSTRDEESMILYEGVVNVMKRLGFRVVAEGAETLGEIELLNRIGIDYIQGFYYSKPLACGELLALIKD